MLKLRARLKSNVAMNTSAYVATHNSLPGIDYERLRHPGQATNMKRKRRKRGVRPRSKFFAQTAHHASVSQQIRPPTRSIPLTARAVEIQYVSNPQTARRAERSRLRLLVRTKNFNWDINSRIEKSEQGHQSAPGVDSVGDLLRSPRTGDRHPRRHATGDLWLATVMPRPRQAPILNTDEPASTFRADGDRLNTAI